MTLSVFPDVNVWLALSSPDHQHFSPAWAWYRALPDEAVLTFCRHTQLGLLRLLTTQIVMGPGTLNQGQAWQAYDRWVEEAGAQFAKEPEGLETFFRTLSGGDQASPKEWADGYLAAFSQVGEMTLVTFDRALAGKSAGSLLLQ
jgi:toxin-antitoxin system PIN domain toxin